MLCRIGGNGLGTAPGKPVGLAAPERYFLGLGKKVDMDVQNSQAEAHPSVARLSSMDCGDSCVPSAEANKQTELAAAEIHLAFSAQQRVIVAHVVLPCVPPPPPDLEGHAAVPVQVSDWQLLRAVCGFCRPGIWAGKAKGRMQL